MSQLNREAMLSKLSRMVDRQYIRAIQTYLDTLED